MAINRENVEEKIFEANDLQRMEGQRPDTWWYYLDGRRYHREIPKKNSKSTLPIYRCAIRKETGCQAKIKTLFDGNLKLIGRHCCEKDVNYLQEFEMFLTLQNQALYTPDAPHEILNRVSSMPQFKDVFQKFAVSRADSIIRRVRRSYRHTPDDLEELGDFLSNDSTHPLNRYFRGKVDYTADEMKQTALIFVSDAMIQQLNRATKIFIDGIMKPVPKKPAGRQIWVIHIKFNDGTTLPAVYAYCDGAKGGLYAAILAKIVELAPALRDCLHTIHIDFEAAEINAVRSIFPTAHIRCCWFHYTQAVLNYWNDLNLEGAPKTCLFYAWALALAPATRYEEGLQLIQERTLLIDGDFPDIHKFWAYLKKQWLPKASLLSVFEEDDRTNNAAEACNRHLTKNLGGRAPTLQTMLFKLAEYIETTDMKLKRLQAGTRITKHVLCKKLKEDDKRIKACQEKLKTEEWDLKTFIFETLSEERKREILQELETMTNGDFTKKIYELASNESLLFAENLNTESAEPTQLTSPCPRIRKRIIKENTDTSILKRTPLRIINEVLNYVADGKEKVASGPEIVQLVEECEEYGSSTTWQSSRGKRGRGRGRAGFKTTGSRDLKEKNSKGNGGRGRGKSRGSRGRGIPKNITKRRIDDDKENDSRKKFKATVDNNSEIHEENEEDYVDYEVLDLQLLADAERFFQE